MNPYEVLGVEKDASPETIKKAYRKLAKEHHPDKKGGNSEKFKDISSAYETLSDPQKKQQFDNGGNPFMGGGSPFDDIFASMFGGNPFQRQRAKRGSDIHVTAQMSLIDVITGANKKLTYTKDVSCNSCSGRGGDTAVKCPTCNGSGQTIHSTHTPYGISQHVIKCVSCDGGYIIKNKCNNVFHDVLL